jgi:hypothetical protein
VTSYTIEYASAPARYTIEFAKGTGPQGPSGGGGGGGGSLTIREVDGSPSVIATELVFQPSRLSVAGTVATVLASNTILSGSGAPANSLGVDGDFYFDSSDAFFYGPKAGGVWADEYVIMNGSPGANTEVTSTSSSSVSIGSGSRTFTIPTAANRGWVVGMRLRAAFDGGNYVEGPITLLTATSVTLNVDNPVGSGTRTSWTIGIAGDRGDTGATGAAGQGVPTGGSTDELLAKVSGVDYATAWTSRLKLNALTLNVEAITYSASMAIDAATATKKHITLGGNGTIQNPTNAVDGRVLIFRLRQDGTGSRIPVWDTKYRFRGDLATVTLSTAANIIDRVAFEYDATDDRWDCISFIKGS